MIGETYCHCHRCGRTSADRPRDAAGRPTDYWDTEVDCGCQSKRTWRSATINCASCGGPVHPEEERCTWCTSVPEGMSAVSSITDLGDGRAWVGDGAPRPMRAMPGSYLITGQAPRLINSGILTPNEARESQA